MLSSMIASVPASRIARGEPAAVLVAHELARRVVPVGDEVGSGRAELVTQSTTLEVAQPGSPMSAPAIRAPVPRSATIALG